MNLELHFRLTLKKTMKLTEEQINKALNRKESFFFTPKEIDKLWEQASTQKNIEFITIKNSYHSAFLDAMYIKAFKIDKNKANEVMNIKEYLLETIQVQKINNLQSELITSLNLKLLESDIKIRDYEKRIDDLKIGI